MPQRPKAEVRSAILDAPGAAFAAVGYQRAALNDIVARANTSIGNLYKYFRSKEELFAAFLPEGFPPELMGRLRAQVEALRAEPEPFARGDDHPYWRAFADLQTFTLEHRDRVVFLLVRAQGTPHEGFPDAVVRLLVALALDYARATVPGFAPTPAKERALTRIYRAFVATLAAILVEERSAHAVRSAVALHTSYHLSGLKGFFVGTLPPGSVSGADSP